jgi:uncharacterized protein (TIGR02598 family)
MLRNRNGFTFVEVTIAIAILAFSLIALIGLLGIGLSGEKSSAEDTRFAGMADYVIATERNNTNSTFATASAANYSSTYYFDLLGNTNSQSAAYALCTVTNISTNSIVTSNTPSTTLVNSNVVGSNVASFKAVFTYPLSAPAANRMTNVYYFNRSNP